MKKISIVLFSSMLALTSASAIAADNQFFVSADVVRSDLDTGVSGFDDTDTSFGIGFGVNLNENFTVQANYQDFGEISVNSQGVNASAEADAFQLSVTGGLPIGDRAGVYAEVGIDMWDGEASASGPGGSASTSDDGTDVFYGFGGYVSITDNAALKLEYQFHDLDGLEIDTLGLGVSFSF